MAALISFLAGSDSTIANLAGSGLGFYGDAGFGAAVDVGSYQGRTFITDSAGALQGPEADNVKYINANSGVLGQSGSGIAISKIPNYLATLNIRSTFDSAVQVQNCKARIYDRVLSTNPASGVTTKGAEIIHVSTSQAVTGSGDVAWTTFTSATGVYLDLAPSPGVSGLYAGNGSNSVRPDTQHDHYVALSASPDSIGSKTFGLYVSLEYL